MRLSFVRDWLFWLGLTLRLGLIAVAAPAVQTKWFAPFLSAVPRNGPLPWGGFLASGGDPAAFPYGLPNILALGPGVWLGDVIAGPAGARIGLGLTILIFDVVLLAVLCRLAEAVPRKVVLLYWLSPLVLYVGYWHGQIDMFPAALVMLAMAAIAARRHLVAGVAFGLAIAAKLSMLLAAPFIALYYLGRSRVRGRAAAPIAAAALVAGGLLLPPTLSAGFRQMVLQTRETAKTFSFAVPIEQGLNLYILPIAALALLYAAWRTRKLDFEALWTFSGVMFMAFVLLTPASPGWAMWALPFVVLHVAASSFTGALLYAAFTASFLALHLMVSSGSVVLGRFDFTTPLAASVPNPERVASVLFTLLFLTGAALAVQMLRRGVNATLFRAATRRPLVLGISGDSGAGKDTLVDCIAGVFGQHALSRVSGDDYHVWDRQKPMWRALTHLNPRANDLEAFANSVRQLARGYPARAPHYDHNSGRMTKPVEIRPAEIVAASGLHALWSPALNTLYDVRIFLDMDEDLRRFLKVRRDVAARGQALEKALELIERRTPDAERFIRPQGEAADIVLRLEPRHSSALSEYGRPDGELSLRLIVRARAGRDFDRLARLLVSLCGIQAIERRLETGEVELLIEDEPTAEDIAAAARRLAPGLEELLAVEPHWEGGLRGVLQLVVLDQINRVCRHRSTAA
jgi:uridine kinase